ncbi:DsbA family protein [Enterococcus cecorum]|nr:DsbA family protein [Enterococcus cecorum]
MNEVYLFINPLESSLAQLMPYFTYFRQIYHENARLQVVPLVNLQIVRDYLRVHQLPLHLEQQNTTFQEAYQLALDFKAAQLQGNKYARQFLCQMQRCMEDGYSFELADQVFRELSADFEMFAEDRQSDLCKQLFQLACEMKVKTVDTLTCFNYQYDQKYGYLIEGLDNIKRLPEFIQPETSGKITYLDWRAYK